MNNQTDQHSRKREGEVESSIDPACIEPDAGIVFIGRISSPWKTRRDCPKNLRQARERSGVHTAIMIDQPWRKGLTGLIPGSLIHALYWMDKAPRNLIVQKPRHRDQPAGVFSLRSPARPNPLALALVKVKQVDIHKGLLLIDAIDALDGTPVVDIKPYLPSIDLIDS